MGHAIRTWSVVCSATLHSQFGEGARSHLCMDEWNCTTPVLKWLSLTQAAQEKPVPTGLALVLGIEAWSLEAFSQYSTLHLWFVHLEVQMPSLARLFKRFCTADTNRHVDLRQASEEPLEDHIRYNQGPEIHDGPRRVLLPVSKAQLAGCLKV